ncbi:hypothetical protein [Klugiella xanthotipulae]|uniref:Uncharacterized protein n=1 Tax=Klugiella xanthotipulae TaxID=244735 RepID=A0A543I4E4_9MICO|nr:hypothetical protein [Klugiella xanthotipulae]TQM65473.1 hypothetical protein FB466_0276 [Klugiella xanthotipulae]
MTNFSVVTRRGEMDGRGVGGSRSRLLGFARLAGGVFLGLTVLVSGSALFSLL